MVVVEKRLIAVAGATGAQGGSVVRFLLQDGTFRIRGLTRKPGSEKAKELQGKGVDIVFADFEDPSTLTAALHGAYGVFGVTNYWESVDGERETRHGKALVDAAKANNVQHFVWSTVSVSKDFDVKHWISKARVNDYLVASGIPRTSLYTTFYFENFVFYDFWKLSKVQTESGPDKYIANWPLLLTDGPIGGYSVTETGAYVVETFKYPKKWIGKDIYVPPDIFTPRMLVDALNEALAGKAVVEIKEIDETAFEATRSSFPGVEELWANMAAFYKAGGKMRNMSPSETSEADAARDEEIEKAILPSRVTMEDWVREHAEEIISLAR